MRIKGRTGRALAATLGIAALSLLSMMPAHADNVTVDLYFWAGVYTPNSLLQQSVQIPIPCQVTVAEGTSASGVLDAAVQQGCIVSWQPTPSGSSVACINFVCSRYIIPCVLANPFVHAGWSVVFDGLGGPWGFNQFHASPGSKIEAHYTVANGICPL